MDEFDYFMIRTLRRGIELPLSGRVEHLATGEKLEFRSGEELMALLSRWPGSGPFLSLPDPSDEIQP